MWEHIYQHIYQHIGTELYALRIVALPNLNEIGINMTQMSKFLAKKLDIISW